MSKAAGIVFLLPVLAMVAPAHAARDDLVLASRVSGASGAAANANSTPTAISADGRFVAFSSFATNLSDETTGGHEAVFVRDLEANTTTLASRATGAGGEGADDDSLGASMSADGRFVAFESRADNLSADDANGTIDVFVRDLQTATTTLVSRASGMGAGGDDHSGGPAMSGDGRRVAFLSYADNLSDADNDAVPDIFVRDLQTNTTILVSRATDGTPAADERLSTVLDLGRRAVRRLLLDRRTISAPEDVDDVAGHLRPRPADEHHHARQPRERRRRGEPADGNSARARRSRPTGASSPSTRTPPTSSPTTTTRSRTSSSATCRRTPRRW